MVRKLMNSEAHMPECLEGVKAPPRPRKETAKEVEVRSLINKKLEEAAREVEALARNFPNWRPALSSAAERIRAKKQGARGGD